MPHRETKLDPTFQDDNWHKVSEPIINPENQTQGKI